MNNKLRSLAAADRQREVIRRLIEQWQSGLIICRQFLSGSTVDSSRNADSSRRPLGPSTWNCELSASSSCWIKRRGFACSSSL
jgi:hypothetical protein